MTRFCAIGNNRSLDIPDLAIGGCGRTPKAKVIDTVDERSLAERIWTFSGAIADVVTRLRSTAGREGVDFVRHVRESKMIFCQR
jgi:hypothetical protein